MLSTSAGRAGARAAAVAGAAAGAACCAKSAPGAKLTDRTARAVREQTARQRARTMMRSPKVRAGVVPPKIVPPSPLHEVRMRTTRLRMLAPVALTGAFAAIVAAPLALTAQVAPVPSAEWEVPWGAQGRPRDPYVAPDGNTYFVGQAGNYIARLDPRSGEFKKYEIDPGTNPHNLIVDQSGMVWYAGNRNGMIGKLDPNTGAITRFPMPDEKVRDPHTLVFDAKGDIWFTAQQSGAVGHLETRTGKIRLAFTGENTRPYGITLDSKGTPWFNLFGTNKIANIDPGTMAVT